MKLIPILLMIMLSGCFDIEPISEKLTKEDDALESTQSNEETSGNETAPSSDDDGVDSNTPEDNITDNEEAPIDEVVDIDPINNGFDTITLRWVAPTRDEVDTEIDPSDIKNYIVHWGEEEDSLTEQVELSADNLEYVFSPDSEGDHYFSISVETIYGDQSLLSNVVHKYVN